MTRVLSIFPKLDRGNILFYARLFPEIMPDYDLKSCNVTGPDTPTPAENHAVEELRYWISEVSGDLPGEGDKNTQLILENDDSLGPEEFSIRPSEGKVVISGGRPRGVLYGSYELLDRFCGVRWLAEDQTTVPSKDKIWLSPDGVNFSPVLNYREPYFTEGFDGDWAARNRLNSNRAGLSKVHGGRINYVGFVHTFNLLVPPEDFFSSHPEYFSEVEGKRISEHTQLCLTNPDVVRLAAEKAISWLDETPGADLISISQNDWRNPCQCKTCSKIDEEEGTHAGSLLDFVNEVAERIEEKHPDVLVDTLAYQYTRKATRTIRPRRNVVVRLCSIECCFSHPLETCTENRSFRRDTEDWARVAHTLYVWDYVTNFKHYVMPFPNLRVLQPNVQFFVKNNVRGIFEEGSYPDGGGGEFGALRSYLLARILWEPGCDVEEALTEFLEGYYGRAAKAIRGYIDELHNHVERENIHVRIYDDPGIFLNSDFVKDSLGIFKDAEKKAGDEKVRRRIRLAALPLEYSSVMLMDDGEAGKRSKFLEFIEKCRSMGITQIREGRSLEDSIKEILG